MKTGDQKTKEARMIGGLIGAAFGLFFCVMLVLSAVCK